MTNLGATGQDQLVSTVIQSVEVNLVISLVLVRVAGGVVIPLIILKQRVSCSRISDDCDDDCRFVTFMQHLAVTLVQHVLLRSIDTGEPLPFLIAPQAHVTLANLTKNIRLKV